MRWKPTATRSSPPTAGRQASTPSARREQRDEHFAVVITDLGMPYVDGRKVATAIKSDSPSTPVILLTGWGQRLVAEGDIPPHVDRVLNKPPKLGSARRAGGIGRRPVRGIIGKIEFPVTHSDFVQRVPGS